MASHFPGKPTPGGLETPGETLELSLRKLFERTMKALNACQPFVQIRKACLDPSTKDITFSLASCMFKMDLRQHLMNLLAIKAEGITITFNCFDFDQFTLLMHQGVIKEESLKRMLTKVRKRAKKYVTMYRNTVAKLPNPTLGQQIPFIGLRIPEVVKFPGDVSCHLDQRIQFAHLESPALEPFFETMVGFKFVSSSTRPLIHDILFSPGGLAKTNEAITTLRDGKLIYYYMQHNLVVYQQHNMNDSGHIEGPNFIRQTLLLKLPESTSTSFSKGWTLWGEVLPCASEYDNILTLVVNSPNKAMPMGGKLHPFYENLLSS